MSETGHSRKRSRSAIHFTHDVVRNICILIIWYQLHEAAVYYKLEITEEEVAVAKFNAVYAHSTQDFGKNLRDDITGEWRKLHSEKLHNLYSFQNIIR
jgi:hypothetical protein